MFRTDNNMTVKLPYHQQMLQQTVMAAEDNNMNFHQ